MICNVRHHCNDAYWHNDVAHADVDKDALYDGDDCYCRCCDGFRGLYSLNDHNDHTTNNDVGVDRERIF